MNSKSVQPVPFSLEDVLRERCTSLGLPLWHFDADCEPISRPGGVGIEERLYGSAAFLQLVRGAVRLRVESREWGVTELFEDGWLAVVPMQERRRISGSCATFLPGERALESETFGELCDRAGVDVDAAREALTSTARYTETTAQRVASMLNWTTQDLRAINQKNNLVREFSQELSDTFEEISLFYTLGQSMNELAHPEKFVNVACEELHEALMYGWVAAAFVEDQYLVRGMAGKLTQCGEIPCPPGEFEYAVKGLIKQLTLTSPSVLKPEEAGPLGADGMQVLVRPVVHGQNVVGVLLAGGKSGKDTLVSTVDTKIFDAAAGHLSVLLDNSILFEDQQLMFLGTLEALSASIDAKDPYTCGHSERVALLSKQLALILGMSESEAERIHIGGLVHDVGKIGVPESTLCKAGRLTDEEFEQIKLHPRIGHDILKDIPQFADVLPGVLYHHERYGGGGYPEGITGEQTPLIARIIGLADAFDAMSSTRTYRAAMDRETVLREIQDCAGTQFDPEIAEAFLAIDLTAYDELVSKHQDQSNRGGGHRTSRRREAA